MDLAVVAAEEEEEEEEWGSGDASHIVVYFCLLCLSGKLYFLRVEFTTRGGIEMKRRGTE
jgi:hypothetical protein